jgi:hypothetical protein
MSNYRKTMSDALREMYPLTEETQLDEGTIDKVKEIASKKQAMKIDGVMVDSFTASAISQIYDKVNDANKKKMEKLPITKLANLAMKMMQKNEFVPEEVDLDEGKILFADPKTQKVTKIDEKDWPEYKKKGYVQAEDVDLDEADDFKPHMMYDPKTGKGYKADTMDDHLRMKKMGYTHDAPKKEEVDLDEANFEIKNGKIHISKADYAKKPKEYKGKRGGKPTLMALDPKTGSTTSFEVVLEEVDLDEASARSDAMKAMRKGKSVDPADIDNTATDDDVRGASKNIIMQLRKAGNRASMGVEFGDGKKVQISPKMAIAVQQKYNAMKKPADKEKFQARIAKSYKDMLSALKEELQPKKESILERMNRKIKENKNG